MININLYDPKDKKNPSNYNSWKLFVYFLNGLEILCSDKELDPYSFCRFIDSDWEYTNYSCWQIRNIFREGYKDGTLNFSDFSDGRVLYLSRCLGHKISEKLFFKFPRLCVLYNLTFLKGRWREAEDHIVKDDLAVYLYSKYVVGGILPEKMHTEIVLGTILRKSVPIQKYFSEIEPLQRKKLCYN